MVNYDAIFNNREEDKCPTEEERAQEKAKTCACEEPHAQEDHVKESFRYATLEELKTTPTPEISDEVTLHKIGLLKSNEHLQELKPPTDVFDLEIAKSKMDADSVNDLVLKAEMLVVETDADAQNGVSIACQSKKMRNKIEDTRKQIVRPHLDFQKSIKLYVDEFSKCLKEMEITVLKKVNIFQDKKNLELKKTHDKQMKQERAAEEARRKEEEERMKEEVARKLAKGEVALPKAIVTPPPPPKQEAFVPPPQKITTASGTLTTIVLWTYEVKDEAKVPREYLMINERAIKEAVAGGIRNIDGVKIFEKSETRSRVR